MSTSEVRTVCGSSARTDLCGGRSERPSLPRLRVFSSPWSSVSHAVAVCAVLLALCVSADAQQPKKAPRIGFLSAVSPSTISARVEAFLQGLRELGYVEGKNIFIEWRFAQGKFDRLPSLAAELVHLKVDVIVAEAPTSTRSAKQRLLRFPSS